MSILNSKQVTKEGHEIILKVRTGSHCHGTALETSDEDIRGIAVPDLGHFFGTRDFEQSEDKENDIVFYGFKKFFRLAMKGNLSCLNFMFTEHWDILYATEWGHRIIDFRGEFITLNVIDSIMGYIKSQLHRIANSSGRSGNRSELIEKHGYDTKFAYHALMIGNIGIQVLRTGGYTTMRPEHERKVLMDVRRGNMTKEELLNMVHANMDTIHKLERLSKLPKEPNEAKITKFMVDLMNDYFYGSIKLRDI